MMSKLVSSELTKMKNALQLDNWFAFHNELKDSLPLFGDAGEEVNRQQYIVYNKPVRRSSFEMTFICPTTKKKTKRSRIWKDELDEAPFMRTLEQWENKNTTLKQNKTALFFYILKNLSIQVLQKVKNDPTFEAIQDKSDNIKLLKLLKEKILSSGDNTGAALRQSWQNAKQEQKDLDTFLVEFNGCLALLKDTPSYPSVQDQVQTLLDGLTPERYNIYIHEVRLSGTMPTLEEAQIKLKRLDESIKAEERKKRRAEEGGEDSAKAPDGLAMRAQGMHHQHHRSNNNAYSKRRTEQYYHSSSKPQRRSGSTDHHAYKSTRTQATKYNSTSNNNNQNRAGRICVNCNQAGHAGRDCTIPKRVCDFCGRLGHMSLYCRFKKLQERNSGPQGLLNQPVSNKQDNSGNRVSRAYHTTAANNQPSNNMSSSFEDEVISTIEEDEDRIAAAFMTNTMEDTNDYNRKKIVIYIDTGATVNVIKDHALFQSISKYYPLHTGDGKVKKIRGINGNDISVEQSGFIPGLGNYVFATSANANLLSVPQMMEYGGLMFNFTSNRRCIIRHEDMEQVVLDIPIDSRNAWTINTTQWCNLLKVQKQLHEVGKEDQTADPTRYETTYRLTERINTLNDDDKEDDENDDSRSPMMQHNKHPIPASGPNTGLPKPLSKELVKRAKEVMSLHECLGHISFNKLTAGLVNNTIIGTMLTAADVRNCVEYYGPCAHCIAGKRTAPSYKHNSVNQPAQKVGDVLHVDILTLSNRSINNKWNYLLLLDEFSSYLSIQPLLNKGEQSLSKSFTQAIGFYNKHQHKVRTIQSDSESAIKACATYLATKHNVQLIHTPPYQHAQRIERYVRTIKDQARTIIHSLPYVLPEGLYGELLLAITTWLNDFPNSQQASQSPTMIVTGKRTHLDQRKLVPFGSIAMLYNGRRNGQSEPFMASPNADIGIVLGPSHSTYNAVRAYLLASKRVVIRHSLHVLKAIPNVAGITLKLERTAEQLASLQPLITSFTMNKRGENPLSNPPREEEESSSDINHSSSSSPAEEGENEDDTTHNNQAELRRSARKRLRNYKDGPVRLRDDTKRQRIESAYRLSIQAALGGSYAGQAKQAIQEEIHNMLQYKVGHYVRYKDIPQQEKCNIVPSFMFVVNKFKPNGSYDKTKARMVCDGSKQKGHMYEMISSTTVGLTSVMVLLNIATLKKAKVSTYDIKGAFLHAAMGRDDVPIYLKIRREVVESWTQADPTAQPFVEPNGELLLKLDKYIYGLKQSPLKFQEHLKRTLKSMEYVELQQDDCIMIKKGQHDGFSIISIHVDDIMQVTNQEHFVEEMKTKLKRTYQQITFNEQVESYLGMSITQSEDRSKIHLSQQGLLQKLLEEFLHPGATIAVTPAAQTLFEVVEEGEETTDCHSQEGCRVAGRLQAQSEQLSVEEKKNFLSAIMGLMYLARLTRPDILLPVTYLASRSHLANKNDKHKLVRVLRYLKGTPKVGVQIACTGSLQIHCYCDASYGTHCDGRSHTGYIITLGESRSFVHARSCKQKLTALSSTDAEIYAATTASTNITWLASLIDELGGHVSELQGYAALSSILYQDNKSGIWLVTKSSKYRRSKHLLTKLGYLKDLVNTKVLQVKYLPTETMLADCLTKPLQGDSYSKLTSKMVTL